MSKNSLFSDDREGTTVTRETKADVNGVGPRKGFWYYSRIAVLCFSAIAAAAVVSFVSVDLGPALRNRAEQLVSAQIDRQVHIGQVSIYLLTGDLLIEDLVIEGLTPDAKPFLDCKRIVTSILWWPLFRGEFLFDSVDITDFKMLIETFPDGSHNFPNFTIESSTNFVTTIQYLRAHRGQLTYDDQGAPWSVFAPNLDISVAKLLNYQGEASFSDGIIQIGSFEPVGAKAQLSYSLDGTKVHIDKMNLDTDGAESILVGDFDVSNWPEMFYEIRSEVDLPEARDIFFAQDDFSVSGAGEFIGTFHTYEGGRTLDGSFTSGLAGVNAHRFPNLSGSLIWVEDRFDVLEATSDLYGGSWQFTQSMAPLGGDTPTLVRFDANYRDVDLAAYTDFLQIDGIRPVGRATGQNLLEWPLGQYSEHRGEGQLRVVPEAGVSVLGRALPADIRGEPENREYTFEPFVSNQELVYAPIRGELTYSFGPEWVELHQGYVSSRHTYVEFEGETRYGDDSRIQFHVTSSDLQQSDSVLAGILTSFGTPTRRVSIGGFGQFDGVLLGRIRDPRIEGQLATERLRAWGTYWGSGRGDLVIQNNYVDLVSGLVTDGPSKIDIEGRFTLGFPRADGGEEINARFLGVSRPVTDFHHAFRLEGFPIEGALSGEINIFGPYLGPFGRGDLTIDDGMAYGEPFSSTDLDLSYIGTGARVDAYEIYKGGGIIKGSGYVGWDGTYSFNADGQSIAVEQMAAVEYQPAELSGQFHFTASGVGVFDLPSYEVQGYVTNLVVNGENVGKVIGQGDVGNEVLSIEVEASSPQLTMTGVGSIELTPEAKADLTLKFLDTSLDPYARTFEPRLSPSTTASASGTIKLLGELGIPDRVSIEGVIDEFNLSLFDYQVRNENPIRFVSKQQVVHVEQMRLIGDGTSLDLFGEINFGNDQVTLNAIGDANLGILQGFFNDIRSSGEATLVLDVRGSPQSPILLGEAVVHDGRIRHFSLPHALDSVNGQIIFEQGGVRFDQLNGMLGGGNVQFDGRVGLEGYVLGELNVLAVGEQMQLRYPSGFRSIIDADLAVQGNLSDLLLTGAVNVRDSLWVGQLSNSPGILDFASSSRGEPVDQAVMESSWPLRYDIQIVAPSSLRIDDGTAEVVSSAELTLRGTYDQPLLFGNAEIERGEVFFEGNRYRVTRGSIGFANPIKIEPFFDIEAETDVRVPGQTYRLILRATGTMDRLVPELSSDPPLPEVDILSLLLGDTRDPLDGELRALRAPETTEQQFIQASAARLLTSQISSNVGQMIEDSFRVDTFEIIPSISDPSSQQSSRFNPTARLLIGKRISDRAHLTFSRALTGSERDLIVVLEYDQSARSSWIISQNEDRTYALDFRVRHSF